MSSLKEKQRITNKINKKTFKIKDHPALDKYPDYIYRASGIQLMVTGNDTAPPSPPSNIYDVIDIRSMWIISPDLKEYIFRWVALPNKFTRAKTSIILNYEARVDNPTFNNNMRKNMSYYNVSKTIHWLCDKIEHKEWIDNFIGSQKRLDRESEEVLINNLWKLYDD